MKKSELYNFMEAYAAKLAKRENLFFNGKFPVECLFVAIMKIVDLDSTSFLIDVNKFELRFLEDLYNSRYTKNLTRLQVRKIIADNRVMLKDFIDQDVIFKESIKYAKAVGRDIVEVADCLFSITLTDAPVMQLINAKMLKPNCVSDINFQNKEKNEQEDEEKAINCINNNDMRNDISNDNNIFSLGSIYNDLLTFLNQEVIGQKEAVQEFCKGYVSSLLFSEDKLKENGPRGVFLFAGPPGVGKTYLAETAAKKLDMKTCRFDMSEYSSDEASVCTLIGTNPSYRSAKPGILTDFVEQCNKENILNILIFDEIEKSCLGVINLFLQILDAGKVKDEFTGKVCSFKNSYIIFTTNAGRSLYEDGKYINDISTKVIINALKNDVNPKTNVPLFPEAICSRIATGNVAMFRHLSTENLYKIAKKSIKRNNGLIKDKFDIDVFCCKELAYLLILSLGGEVDARVLTAEVKNFIRDNISRLGTYFKGVENDSKLKNIKDFAFLMEADNKIELEKLIFKEELRSTVLFITNQDNICRNISIDGIDIKITSYDNLERVLMEYNRFPIAIFMDMKNQGSLSEENGTIEFLDYAPIESKGYFYLLDAIEKINEFDEEVSIYMIMNSFLEKNVNLCSDLARLGIVDYVVYNELSFENQISEICEQEKMRYVAKRFAREHKKLSFNVVPRLNDNAIVMRLRDFKEDIMVDGVDKDVIISDDRMPDVSFDYIIGNEDIKTEMRSFIEYLTDHKKYVREGKEAPSGILLYGAPGTGKTYFAKALANEAKVPFLSVNGSSFVNIYTGSGPRAIRELFAKARKYAPSIVFIDEIDSIGKKRNGNIGSQATEETLNMLLSEMDGFENNNNRPVLVIAATNYDINPEKIMTLDSALVRRFSRTIKIDLPTTEDRKEYIKRNLKCDLLSLNEMIDSIAVRSIGFNYGNLKNMIALARRQAINNIITSESLDNAFETIRYGKEREWNTNELLQTARHEAGHVFIECKYGRVPEYITIVSRGTHGGYVQRSIDENKGTFSKRELEIMIKSSLAGRAAEIMYYGYADGVTTGASDDIKKAYEIVKSMVCEYGMDDQIGLMYFEDKDIDCDIRKRINESLNDYFRQTVDEIKDGRSQIDSLVEMLLIKNRLNKTEIEKIIK